jgi:hypothetical protein
MKIPKDEFSSGNHDDQCWAKLYGASEEEVNIKKDKYFASYPSQGYNTHVHSRGWLNGYYYIIIDRWHSCD